MTLLSGCSCFGALRLQTIVDVKSFFHLSARIIQQDEHADGNISITII